MSDLSPYQLSKTKKTLLEAGFTNIVMLREAIHNLADPSEFAELFGVEEAVLMELMHAPDLSSIDQLGGQYVALLHNAGIDSVATLSRSDPFELLERIKKVAKQSSVRRLPNRATLEYWIDQARMLCAVR